MKNKFLFLTVIALLCLAPNFCKAAVVTVLSDLGLQAFPMDTGPRPLALGGAFTALADDPNSCFFNPGGLAFSKGVLVSSKPPSDLTAVQAYPTGYGTTIGISVIQAGISNYTAPTLQLVDFSTNTLLLSAGTKASNLPLFAILPQSDDMGLGINLKAILGRTLRIAGAPDRRAEGWQLDIGCLYKIRPWLRFGVDAQNALPAGADSISGGVLKWDNGDLEEVPTILKTGLSAKIVGDANSPIYNIFGNELTLTSNVDMQKNKASEVSFGLEWGINGSLFLRAGYYPITKTGANVISGGLGLKISGWGFDVASFTDKITGLSSYTFSLLYDPQDWAFERRGEATRPIAIADPITNLSPSQEASTYEDRMQITGTAKPQVSIAVNKMPIAKDDNGNFQAIVPLSPGKNLILVEAILGDGKLPYQIKILRKAKITISEEKSLEQEIKSTKDTAVIEKKKAELEKVKDRKQKVETLVTMGIVDVEPNTDFSLQTAVTRGELASWLIKAANIPLPRVTRPVFADVPANSQYAPFIKAAVDYGLMKGSGNYFYPNKPVSKSEAEIIFKNFGAIR